jgi:hypothetical protein
MNVPSCVAPMKCASQTWKLFNEQPETYDLGRSVSTESLDEAHLTFSNLATERPDLAPKTSGGLQAARSDALQQQLT